MPRDIPKENVRAQLEMLQYQASEPDREGAGDEEAPDLALRMAGEPLLVVEVKSREEDREFVEDLEASTPGQAIHARPQPLRYSERVSAAIKKASDQIASYSRTEPTVGVLWVFVADPLVGERGTIQFESTLLGMTYVICTSPVCKKAYYVGRTRFNDYRNIDAVILQHRTPPSTEAEARREAAEGVRTKIRMIVNPFSERRNLLEQTTLYKFAETEGFLERRLVEQEADGDAFIVEPTAEVDRADEDEVLQYLKSKYPLEGIVNFMHPQGFSIATTVQLNDDAEPDAKSEGGGAAV